MTPEYKAIMDRYYAEGASWVFRQLEALDNERAAQIAELLAACERLAPFVANYLGKLAAEDAPGRDSDVFYRLGDRTITVGDLRAILAAIAKARRE